MKLHTYTYTHADIHTNKNICECVSWQKIRKQKENSKASSEIKMKQINKQS